MTPYNSPTERIQVGYPDTPFHCPVTGFIELKDMIRNMRNIEIVPISFNRRVHNFNIFHGKIIEPNIVTNSPIDLLLQNDFFL